jgi:hypothetical protein
MDHEAELQALPDLCNSYVLEGPAQVKIEYKHVKLKFQHTGTWWGAAWLPCHMLSPSGIFQPPLSQCIFIPAGKYLAHSEKNVIISVFFYL